MKKFLGILFIASFLLFSTSIEAQQQPSPCGPYNEIKNKLKKFDVERIGFGFASDKIIYEIYISKRKNTWFIVKTIFKPSEYEITSCLMATGNGWNWDKINEALKGENI